jgi:hypothetical protein
MVVVEASQQWLQATSVLEGPQRPGGFPADVGVIIFEAGEQ